METDKVTVEVPIEPYNVHSSQNFCTTSKDVEVPLKDQQASVFGSKISATNEEFYGSLLDGINEGLNKANKEWTPTEKDREELTKLMKGFQDPLMAQIVGPSHLSQLNNLQNFFTESLEKIKHIDPIDSSDEEK
jgi:hypothetical protein